ncbi:hypothetical protein NESM_000788000 [Novymonas esmeraldas]|uniref:Uncharacterized protein n=1 Tax=Novymonas esmeraldas TaxID=1808958 RepID=A0AAW0EYE7_9TRYP
MQARFVARGHSGAATAAAAAVAVFVKAATRAQHHENQRCAPRWCAAVHRGGTSTVAPALLCRPPTSTGITSSAALHTTARHQASDQFHRFLHNPHVVQPDGVDGLPRVKGDQQQWLNTEQWAGYSDTYLRRHMQYPATMELNNPALNARHDLLYECLGLMHSLYSSLAADLHELHDDPLHPHFHRRIARIKRDREQIAAALDKNYAALHPTVKTVYDAFLVRRYYHLADWIVHVERKRDRLLHDLSPAMMAQMTTMRGLAAQFLQRLRVLEHALYEDPLMGLLEKDGTAVDHYTADELAILRQKATYFRKMRHFGSNQLDADIHTH